MADFDQTTIDVGYYTDGWGPYTFKFPIASSATANDGIIPYGATIASATVKAYQGNVKRTSTLTDETEITGLVDADHAVVIGDDTVKIKFEHPGSSYKGQKATLIFELTLSTGGTKAFYFQYIKIR